MQQTGSDIKRISARAGERIDKTYRPTTKHKSFVFSLVSHLQIFPLFPPYALDELHSISR